MKAKNHGRRASAALFFCFRCKQYRRGPARLRDGARAYCRQCTAGVRPKS
jgi:hypothetical protein